VVAHFVASASSAVSAEVLVSSAGLTVLAAARILARLRLGRGYLPLSDYDWYAPLYANSPASEYLPEDPPAPPPGTATATPPPKPATPVIHEYNFKEEPAAGDWRAKDVHDCPAGWLDAHGNCELGAGRQAVLSRFTVSRAESPAWND
jgi:hypothetical protein